MADKKQLAKVYEPQEVEDRIYRFWMDGGYFHAEVNPDKKPYTIVMPPPNITGQLHMGHALDNTLQDILIRWRRMQGYEALWLPGTDHASIATEAKVVEAQAEVPHAMAEAFKAGNLGVMDYYNMQNVISDTEMRNAISKGAAPQPEQKDKK